jgi:hypothetical protein
MDRGIHQGARPGRSGRSGIVGHTALPTGEWSFRRLLEKLPAGLMTYHTLQAVQPRGRTPPLNDPVDHFCDPFKRLSTDGALIAHGYGSMAQAFQTLLVRWPPLAEWYGLYLDIQECRRVALACVALRSRADAARAKPPSICRSLLIGPSGFHKPSRAARPVAVFLSLVNPARP